MLTYLITGATGFLGTALTRQLASRGRVIGTGFRHAPRQLDLRNPSAVAQLLEDVHPDVLIHTAAYRDPDFCEEHPEEAWLLNVETVRNLTSLLPPQARFVFISSDYVFDGQSPPYHETSERRPLNTYGRTKVEGENLTLARPNSLIVRIPLLVGIEPSYRGAAGFVAQLVRWVARGEAVELDDTLMRYPTLCDDVAAAIAFLCDRAVTGIVHVSSPEGATRYGWAVRTARCLGLPAPHLRAAREPVSYLAQRPRDPQLATTKLRELGFHRFTPFESVVRRVVTVWPELLNASP